MVSHELKMLALFTLIVGSINFIYPPLPRMQNINQPRRRLISEAGVHSSGPDLKMHAAKITKSKLNIKDADMISKKPAYNPENNPNQARGFTRALGKKGSKDNYILFCPDMHPNLGPTNYRAAAARPMDMSKVISLLENGGSYQPFHCIPTDTVAVIIPFSGRGGSLPLFLFSLHIFLQAQLVEYQIFIVKEHKESEPFKPGMLSNIGFVEAQKLRPDINFTCVIFQDLYLAPTDSNNLYRCSDQPKQLVASIDNIPFKHELGGVIAIRPADFREVNGFSNSYTDSESIYLDMYDRLMAGNYTISKPTSEYANYDNLLGHNPLKPRAKSTKFPTINSVTALTSTIYWEDDGLASLSSLSYLVRISKAKLTYTLIEVHTSPGAFTDMPKAFSVNAGANDVSGIMTTETN